MKAKLPFSSWSTNGPFSVFVGLTLATYLGLVDTRAQHGVIGMDQYEKICEYLSEFHNLKPRLLPTTRGGATGVGGDSELVLTAEVPTAIQGISGTVKLNALEESIPLLLPISFSKHLGMILNMPEHNFHWKHIGESQKYEEMPTGHIAVNCFEFPQGGWKHPHGHATRTRSLVEARMV